MQAPEELASEATTMADGLSAAVRTNLIALQRIAGEMGRVQNRLATGKRVNSPSDDPAAYLTASALNARAAALNTVLDGIGTGKKVIEAASAGLEAIDSLVKNLRSLANQALTSASTLAEVTGNVTGLSGATAISAGNGDTITVSDGTTTATYTHNAGQDVQDFIDAVNNTANLNVEARLTSDGRIQLEATGVNNVTIGGTADAGELSAIGLTAGTTTSTSNSLRSALAQQFDQVRTQIDQLAADAGLNGQNLLAGNTLTINLNESGSAATTVSGSLVSASSLGIGAASGSGGNFQFDGDLEAFIAQLDTASTSLQQISSNFNAQLATVSVREDFTKGLSNLLTDGAERLVAADTNTEAAMLLALQTRRDLAATSLSLASEADRTTLRLFGTGG
jgi:flagellin-like hook-associated protein FlgL